MGAWEIARTGQQFHFKVDDTVIGTEVLATHRDPLVSFEVHGTTNQRVIGYVATFKGDPMVLHRPTYVGVFYSETRPEPRRIEHILYRDQKIRVVRHGSGKSSDYLLVLRKR